MAGDPPEGHVVLRKNKHVGFKTHFTTESIRQLIDFKTFFKAKKTNSVFSFFVALMNDWMDRLKSEEQIKRCLGSVGNCNGHFQAELLLKDNGHNNRFKYIFFYIEALVRSAKKIFLFTPQLIHPMSGESLVLSPVKAIIPITRAGCTSRSPVHTSLRPQSTSVPLPHFSPAWTSSFKPEHLSSGCLPAQHQWTPHRVFWMSLLPASVCLGQCKWAVVPKQRTGAETRVAEHERSLSGRVLGSSVCGAHYTPLIKGMASPRHMFRLGEPALTLKKLFAFCFVNCLCF